MLHPKVLQMQGNYFQKSFVQKNRGFHDDKPQESNFYSQVQYVNEEPQQSLEVRQLQQQVARLEDQLARAIAEIHCLSEKNSDAPSNHALEGRLLRLERQANAKHYLEPPKLENPPFNPYFKQDE